MRVPPRLLLLLAFLFLAPSASDRAASTMGEGWCHSDPVISIGGHQASVFVSTLANAEVQSQSHAYVLISYPRELEGELLWIDPNHGFGRGMNASVVPGDLPFSAEHIAVRINVRVSGPVSGTPVAVEWAPGPLGSPISARVYGSTNSWIAFTAVLPIS